MTSDFDERRPEDLLDAYVDGLLDEPSRERFERAIAERPDLEREVARQRAIDDSLSRALGPPPETELRALLPNMTAATPGDAPGHARPGRAALRFPLARPVAVAAALALFATGTWLMWQLAAPRPGPEGIYAPLPPQDPGEVYASAIASGFQAEVECRDGDEFEMWFRQQFRRPLRLREPLPEGTVALGLGYSNSVSPATIQLLATADGARIMVFIDRLDRGIDWEPDESSGLHLHRDRAGDLALYELSPLGEPRLLRQLYDPEAE